MRRLLSLSIILSFIASTLSADSFDEIRAEIMANNLSAKAGTLRSNSEIENMLGKNTLESPEVEFGRLWNTQAGGIDKWSLSVSQSFDWPGVYTARREAARTSRIASQYLLESTMLDLRQEVGTVLIDIIHNSQLIAMQSELVDSMNRLEAHYKKAADAGAETRLDYNKTVLERIAVHKELHSLEAQRENLLFTLQGLNGGLDVTDIVNRLGTSYPIVSAVNESTLDLVKERDPEYAAAIASAEASKAMTKVEKRSLIPGFSLGYEHEREGDESFNGFTVGLTLPVWGRKHQIKATQMEREASLIEAEMALDRRISEMQGDLRQLKSLETILSEYEPVINNQANFTLLRKALLGGQINFLTYIQEVNYFIAARRDYLDTLYEYNLLLLRLSRYN